MTCHVSVCRILSGQLFPEVEVNIGEYLPIFTEPEANNYFSIIFRREYHGLKKRTKTKNYGRNCSFAYKYAAAVLIISHKQAKLYEK